MFRQLAFNVVYLAYLLSTAIGLDRQQHHVQHGPCSYTFILPEVEHCHPLNDFQVTNTLQRDSPPEASADSSPSKAGKAQKERPSWQERKLESLESAMENNTQWLQKVWLSELWKKKYHFISGFAVAPSFSFDPITSIDNFILLIFAVLNWDFLDVSCLHLLFQDIIWCMNVSLFKTSGMPEVPVACEWRKTRWNRFASITQCQVCLTLWSCCISIYPRGNKCIVLTLLTCVHSMHSWHNPWMIVTRLAVANHLRQDYG